jgi:hypothetical protein
MLDLGTVEDGPIADLAVQELKFPDGRLPVLAD